MTGVQNKWCIKFGIKITTYMFSTKRSFNKVRYFSVRREGNKCLSKEKSLLVNIINVRSGLKMTNHIWVLHFNSYQLFVPILL